MYDVAQLPYWHGKQTALHHCSSICFKVFNCSHPFCGLMTQNKMRQSETCPNSCGRICSMCNVTVTVTVSNSIYTSTLCSLRFDSDKVSSWPRWCYFVIFILSLAGKVLEVATRRQVSEQKCVRASVTEETHMHTVHSHAPETSWKNTPL